MLINNKKVKNGFTLAEVLIVLGIIGIVAALTIPTLIQNAHERATVSQLKKVYSEFSQAYQLAINENGYPADNWAGSEDTMSNTLAKYLKLSKNCSKQECEEEAYNTLTEKPYTAATKPNLILSDGTIILLRLDTINCTTLYNRCGWFIADVNGYSKPNVLGKDAFFFAITNTQILPFGLENNKGIMHGEDFINACSKQATYQPGLGCSAWVIYNENMDYLHCDGLSWEGKKNCK